MVKKKLTKKEFNKELKRLAKIEKELQIKKVKRRKGLFNFSFNLSEVIVSLSFALLFFSIVINMFLTISIICYLFKDMPELINVMQYYVIYLEFIFKVFVISGAIYFILRMFKIIFNIKND